METGSACVKISFTLVPGGLNLFTGACPIVIFWIVFFSRKDLTDFYDF